jgi:hypothetical protein
MPVPSRYFSIVVAILLLSACREQVLSPPLQTSREEFTELQSDVVCGLNTRPIFSISEQVPYADARALAGFRSIFYPGPQPVACNRLQRSKVQGLVQFTGTLDPALPAARTSAFLEIVSFEPAVPVNVTEARPWGTGVVGTWSGDTRNSCRFEVKWHGVGGDTSWSPGPAVRGLPWIPSVDLAAASSSQFWAPLVRPVLVNVTDEFRTNLRGDQILLRLSIEPNDRAMISQATNDCYGRFTVRLKLVGPD